MSSGRLAGTEISLLQMLARIIRFEIHEVWFIRKCSLYFTQMCIFRYRNYPPEQLVDIVARILAMVPPWTRVYRVQRDIPMPLVTSGVEKGNLRELALARMDDLGLKCRDVRTREAGIQVLEHG